MTIRTRSSRTGGARGVTETGRLLSYVLCVRTVILHRRSGPVACSASCSLAPPLHKSRRAPQNTGLALFRFVVHVVSSSGTKGFFLTFKTVFQIEKSSFDATRTITQVPRYRGIPDLRAPRNRLEIQLLSPHSSYPRLRTICSYLGIRANSLLSREIFLLEERRITFLRREKSGETRLFIAYSS